MTIEISDQAFGEQAIHALDQALLGLTESKRLGLISPQEAANLRSRFLNLKAQVLRGLDRHDEAKIAERSAVLPFTQLELWEF